MRVGEFYSIIAMIFANNFNDVLIKDSFDKAKATKQWIISNDTDNNKMGAKFYQDFLDNESLAELRTDFRGMKEKLIARYYFSDAKDNLLNFYNALNFKPKLGEIDSISNQLLFISTILKNELDEKNEKILVLFLVHFFLPYATILAPEISETAKSSFYKSMGYFLMEFCLNLQNTFNIKSKK